MELQLLIKQITSLSNYLVCYEMSGSHSKCLVTSWHQLSSEVLGTTFQILYNQGSVPVSHISIDLKKKKKKKKRRRGGVMNIYTVPTFCWSLLGTLHTVLFNP